MEADCGLEAESANILRFASALLALLFLAF